MFDVLSTAENDLDKDLEIIKPDSSLHIQQQSQYSGIIRCSGKWRIRWDLFIITLALYNGIYLPYEIAFNPDVDIGINILNYTVDVLFAFDIVVCFRSTYFYMGEEIFNPRQIAKHYIKSGHFQLDLLATIPFDLLVWIFSSQNSSQFQLFSLLKLIRLIRLRRIITYLKFNSEMKLNLRFSVIIASFLLFIHIVGCLWYMVIISEKQWIPPKDLGRETEIYDDSYIDCAYYSTLIIFGSDVLPVTDFELLFVGIVLVIGGLVKNYIFASMTVLIDSMMSTSNIQDEETDTASCVMNTLILPEKLQTQILEYLSHSIRGKDKQILIQQFFDFLSPSLRKQVQMELFNRVFSLYFAPAVIDFFIGKIRLQLESPEFCVIHFGDIGEVIYFIYQGQVDIWCKKGSDKPVHHRQINKNNYFGEVAVLQGKMRTASVYTATYCTFFKIDGDDFKDAIVRFPQIKSQFTQQMINYNDPWLSYIRNLLYQIPYFKECSYRFIKMLSFSVLPVYYRRNQTLLNLQDFPNNIIIIASGVVVVQVLIKNVYKTILELGKGSFANLYTSSSKLPSLFRLQVVEPGYMLFLSVSQLQLISQQEEQLGKALAHIRTQNDKNLPDYSDFLPFLPLQTETQQRMLIKFRLLVERIMRSVQKQLIQRKPLAQLGQIVRDYLQLQKDNEVSDRKNEFKMLIFQANKNIQSLTRNLDNYVKK